MKYFIISVIIGVGLVIIGCISYAILILSTPSYDGTVESLLEANPKLAAFVGYSPKYSIDRGQDVFDLVDEFKDKKLDTSNLSNEEHPLDKPKNLDDLPLLKRYIPESNLPIDYPLLSFYEEYNSFIEVFNPTKQYYDFDIVRYKGVLVTIFISAESYRTTMKIYEQAGLSSFQIRDSAPSLCVYYPELKKAMNKDHSSYNSISNFDIIEAKLDFDRKYKHQTKGFSGY
jgi:hypothetical protein